MGTLDDVLARLVNEPGFRAALARDPQAALAGYDLSSEDLALLATSIDEGTGGEHGVEQRTSKSSLVGLLGGLTGPTAASEPPATDPDAELATQHVPEAVDYNTVTLENVYVTSYNPGASDPDDGFDAADELAAPTEEAEPPDDMAAPAEAAHSAKGKMPSPPEPFVPTPLPAPAAAADVEMTGSPDPGAGAAGSVKDGEVTLERGFTPSRTDEAIADLTTAEDEMEDR